MTRPLIGLAPCSRSCKFQLPVFTSMSVLDTGHRPALMLVIFNGNHCSSKAGATMTNGAALGPAGHPAALEGDPISFRSSLMHNPRLIYFRLPPSFCLFSFPFSFSFSSQWSHSQPNSCEDRKQIGFSSGLATHTKTSSIFYRRDGAPALAMCPYQST